MDGWMEHGSQMAEEAAACQINTVTVNLYVYPHLHFTLNRANGEDEEHVRSR